MEEGKDGSGGALLLSSSAFCTLAPQKVPAQQPEVPRASFSQLCVLLCCDLEPASEQSGTCSDMF